MAASYDSAINNKAIVEQFSYQTFEARTVLGTKKDSRTINQEDKLIMILNILINLKRCIAKSVSQGEIDESVMIEVLKNCTIKLLEKTR